MKVSEIKADAQQVLQYCEDTTLYNRLTQAVEVLSNEGQWDSLLSYMDIVVNPDNTVSLPRDVESPIKININNHPAFSHDRLYEFTLNGPGNDMAETSGWAWMDKGRTPVGEQPMGETLAAFCQNDADVGKTIRIFGYDNFSRECTDEITFLRWGDNNNNATLNHYSQITRIDKDVTVGQVGLFTLTTPVPPPGPPPPPPPDPPPPPPGPPPPSPPPPGPPPPPVQVEDPVLYPPSGTYPRRGGYIEVRISTRTAGASLSYTTDGSTPTRTHGHIITHNIALVRVRLPNHQEEGDVTVKAMGFETGLLDSHVITGQYHIIPVRSGEGSDDDTLPRIIPPLTPKLPDAPVSLPPDPDAFERHLIAIYYGDETEPSYRQIKLTKNATAIRMLYRRRTYKITSDDDWIPLDSTMAILTMLKALEAIRNGDTEELQKVDSLFKQAVRFLQQEQATRMQFAVDAQKEIPATLAVTYGLLKGQTGLLAADLKADAMVILGNCEDTTYYNRLTHAIEVLANEGQWESLQAYLNIPVQGDGIVTLPRDVEMPMKININDEPAFSRAKLYEFTLNGPGSDMRDALGWNWMMGDTVPVGLQPNNEKVFAGCENLLDVGKKMRIRGIDKFNRECYDELTISPISLNPPPTPSLNFYARITNVEKDVTIGQVALCSIPLYQHAPPPVLTMAPHFDPPPGTYHRHGSMTVDIITDTPDASISYTTDGTTPSRGHGFIVNHPRAAARLRLPPHQNEGDITLEAMAFKDGLHDSSVTIGVYHLIESDSPVTPEDPIPTQPDTRPELLQNDDAGLVASPEDLPPDQQLVTDFVILAIYYSDEVQPRYRQIRVSGYPEAPQTLKILYRRRTRAITSDGDWIPLNSRMAILTQMRALEALRSGKPEDMQSMDVYQKLALHYLQMDQAKKDNYDLAAQSEKANCLNLGIYNADSLVAGDIYDDFCDIFGQIGRGNIYDKITDSVELMANGGQWDGMHGYVDLITDNHRWITLPMYIENIITLNINREPRAFRNKWFEFHLNGPGTKMPSCAYYEDAGEFVTIRPLYGIVQPICYSNLASDTGKVVIIEGLDENGLPIRTQYNNQWINGVRVKVVSPGSLVLASTQKISRIDRILKQPSNGFISLWGYERAVNRATPLGLYYPDETEPNYRRIKLDQAAAWVRIRYRKRALKITGLGDPLHLKSRLAIVSAARAIKALEKDPAAAEAYEKKAMEYLEMEQASRNPAETFSVQFEGITTEDYIP